MRKRNWRFIVTGLVVLMAAIGVFLGMLVLVPRSNDPVTLMQTAGQVSGAIATIGIVLIILGYIGRKQ